MKHEDGCPLCVAQFLKIPMVSAVGGLNCTANATETAKCVARSRLSPYGRSTEHGQAFLALVVRFHCWPNLTDQRVVTQDAGIIEADSQAAGKLWPRPQAEGAAQLRAARRVRYSVRRSPVSPLFSRAAVTIACSTVCVAVTNESGAGPLAGCVSRASASLSIAATKRAAALSSGNALAIVAERLRSLACVAGRNWRKLWASCNRISSATSDMAKVLSGSNVIRKLRARARRSSSSAAWPSCRRRCGPRRGRVQLVDEDFQPFRFGDLWRPLADQNIGMKRSRVAPSGC